MTAPQRELRCTWCGSDELHVELEYLLDTAVPRTPVVAGFWCGNERCGAEWEADLTVRTAGEERVVTHWTERAPQSLLDPLDPRGAPCPTPMDRRWLWRLEQKLVGGTAAQQELATDLHQYLAETCQHHWLDYTECCDPPDAGCGPPFRQCLWCQKWGEAS